MSTKHAVHIIVRFFARPEAQEELHQILTPLIEPTRRSAGCLGCELLHNHFDPTEFTFIEVWESQKAVHRHLTADYLHDMASRLERVLASPPHITLYGRIDP